VQSLLQSWWQSAKERRYLASLNDHDLRDLGLSRDDVACPPTHFFWRQ
jgi:uncharacterized protein YjiS (DUF1127 family)